MKKDSKFGDADWDISTDTEDLQRFIRDYY